MTRENYTEHLAEKLRGIDSKIAMARKKLDEGKASDKVAAARELSVLEARHQELQEKIDQASKEHAENWSSAHIEYKEDLDALLYSLERWITKY